MAIGAILVPCPEDTSVVVFMTGRAALRVVKLHGQGFGPPALMAFLTRDAGMLSPQREFGLAMVEFLVGHSVPVDGGMA